MGAKDLSAVLVTCLVLTASTRVPSLQPLVEHSSALEKEGKIKDAYELLQAAESELFKKIEEVLIQLAKEKGPPTKAAKTPATAVGTVNANGDVDIDISTTAGDSLDPLDYRSVCSSRTLISIHPPTNFALPQLAHHYS